MSSLTIGAFLSELDRIVSGLRAAQWDVHGLQLGDPARAVESVAVCHEVTEEVVSAVEREPVDLLVAYHPLLFHPTTRLVAGRSPGGRALRLLEAGTAVAVAHTAFDATPGGTADALAAAVGIGATAGLGLLVPGGQLKVVTFVPGPDVERVAAAMARAGGGRIGAYSACSFRSDGVGAFLPGSGARPAVGAVGEPSREAETRLEMIVPERDLDAVSSALVAAHPYEEPAFDVYEVRANLGFAGRIGDVDPTPFPAFVEAVQDGLGMTEAGGLRASGVAAREVRRVAVVPGSGGSFVAAAAAAGADVLVTGDVGHHTVVEATDRGMAVVDVGHAAGERPGVAVLAHRVAGIGPPVLDLTGMDPTPWR